VTKAQELLAGVAITSFRLNGQFLELAVRMGAERLAEALSAMRALSQAVDSLSERH
jgi:hypothetical protein